MGGVKRLSLWSNPITDADQRKVWYGNAVRCYGLDA
jgi:hypothetical protein